MHGSLFLFGMADTGLRVFHLLVAVLVNGIQNEVERSAHVFGAWKFVVETEAENCISHLDSNYETMRSEYGM